MGQDEIDKLISLFKKYGFEYRKTSSGKNFYAFTYKAGFFHNAELIYTEDVDKGELEKIIIDLTNLGFSTKKSLYINLNHIENNLFNGFFNVEEWKNSSIHEYKNHCKKILSILPDDASEYSYVEVDFQKKGKSGKVYDTQDTPLIEDILTEITVDDKAKLILIEAPAGFGKTCTSYEILNKLASNKSSPPPFFTEFSRDRQAKIFNHIFVSEVDRKFQSVRSNLVIEETQNGKIILILDGFDELLNESTLEEEENNYEQAQPMLETIGEMLSKQAKLILTSRRAAIFDGEMFDLWEEKYQDRFNVIRYKLDTPKISDWLSEARIEYLKNHNINIAQLSNPVLLSYLRALNDDNFKSLCSKDEEIINYYFESMLERERERQQLFMTPSQQSEILTTIALDMCEKDYTADSKEEIMNLIKHECYSILEESRALYPAKDRPTIDNLANKLATHAFLDRSNQGNEHIQFINEFVFGNYIASGILNLQENNDWVAPERFINSAVQAYFSRKKESRMALWKALIPIREAFTATEHMNFESYLTKIVDQKEIYSNTTITDLDFSKIYFFNKHQIVSSVFNKCTFSNCEFNLDNLKDVTFLSSNFYDCTYKDKENSYEVSFLNCYSNNEFINELEVSEEVSIDEDAAITLEKEILSKFLPQGSNSIERLHVFTTNLYKIDGYTKKDIVKAIKRLKSKGFLEDAHNSSFTAMNKESIAEIKVLLGRN